MNSKLFGVWLITCDSSVFYALADISDKPFSSSIPSDHAMSSSPLLICRRGFERPSAGLFKDPKVVKLCVLLGALSLQILTIIFVFFASADTGV